MVDKLPAFAWNAKSGAVSMRWIERDFARALISLVIGVSFSGAVFAQDAGSLLREQERRRELERLERARPAQPEVAPQPSVARPELGETFLVKELRFAGKTEGLTETQKATFAAQVQDQPVGVAGLQNLADNVTRALQGTGRLLARAILPPQDVTDGIVTLEIVEGTLEKIEFQRDERARIEEGSLRSVIEGRLDPAAVTKTELEAALLRMNDLPGVTAQARLQPGHAPNSSRLVIAVQEAPALASMFWGDNYGDPGAGRAQANALVTLNDLTGFGEHSYIRGSFSEGMKFGTASVAAPLHASDLTLRGEYSYLAYENRTDIGESLQLEGRSQRLAVGADYGIVRSRTLNLRLSADVSVKALEDDSIIGRLGDRRSRAGTLSFSGDAQDDWLDGGLTSFVAGVTVGNLDLSRLASAQAVDAAGLNTEGGFTRVNLSLARVQDLPGAFSLIGRVHGQWADENFDSSEDFSLGGPYGVRAYPVGEGRGDHGILGTIELRHDTRIPAAFGGIQLAAFLDAGRIRVNANPNGIPIATASGRNDYSLSGAGLSLRWTLKRLNLSTAWAHTLGSNPGRSGIDGSNSDGESDRQTFWIQAALRF
jgi:hemolysin activation/secretion protein